jgi:hypothetical protein
MYFDLPPKLWMPPRPAIIRAASMEDVKREAQARKRILATFPFPTFMPSKVFGTVTQIASSFSASVNASSITAATSAAIPAGALAVIVVGCNTTNSVTVSSVSDGTNSYTKATSVSQNGGVGETSIWYKLNASAVSSGATITVNFSGASGSPAQAGLIGAYVTGPSALDKTNQGTAASTTTSISTGTLSQSLEIIFGGNFENNAASPTYTTPSGFTNVATNVTGNNGAIALDYKKVTSTGSVTYAPSWSTGSGIGAVLATFN